MTTSLVGQRTPVAIDDGLIRAGSQTAAFDRTQPETLLRNYLRLIRRARSQQRAPEISLRREDVEALADFLGMSAESVLHRLATLMGSSRTQRTTVLAAFASGALLIGLSGSVAATSPLLDDPAPGLADSTVSVAVVDDDDVDVLVDVLSDAPATPTDPAPTETSSDPVSAPADAPLRRSTVVTGDTGADRTAGVDSLAESDASVANGGQPASDRTADDRPATPGDADVPVDDVALVSPVVPDVTDDVAVGDALVAPSTPNDPGGDASKPVEPPVTATTVAPADDIPQELPPVDDDTVAVGPPPLPPTTTTVPSVTTAPVTTAPVTTIP